MGRGALLYLLSFGAHGVLAIGVYALPAKAAHEKTPVTFVVAPKKKAEKPKELPPEPKPVENTKAKAAPSPVHPAPIAAKAAPAPEPLALAPSPAPGPDFGVTLSGGGGGGGPAIAGGGVPPGGSGTGPGAAETVRKVLAPAPKADTCEEPVKKPKAIAVPQPAYTEAARAAGVAGRVRVEITVDERGRVAKVRVLEGLGHGLDEAALAAARAATFEAGTRCGKPTAATFTVSMRFSL